MALIIKKTEWDALIEFAVLLDMQHEDRKDARVKAMTALIEKLKEYRALPRPSDTSGYTIAEGVRNGWCL